MSKTITIKNELPELLATVCNHPDCPSWLSGEIWDSFNNRMLDFEYTANFFRYALEQTADIDNCYSCGQPLFPHSMVWHKNCEFTKNPDTDEQVKTYPLKDILDLSDHPTEEGECIDLANHISAILKNPKTPTKIYNALSDELGSIDMSKDFVDSPEYVLQILRKKEGGE